MVSVTILLYAAWQMHPDAPATRLRALFIAPMDSGDNGPVVIPKELRNMWVTSRRLPKTVPLSRWGHAEALLQHSALRFPS